MATLLIVDSKGNRRVRLEMAAQTAGHHTYSAGSAEEALRLVGIYVPDLLVLPDEKLAGDFVSQLLASPREWLRHRTLITSHPNLLPKNPQIIAAKNTVEGILETVENTLLKMTTPPPDKDKKEG